MIIITPFNYLITLSTGEKITVAEFDAEHIPTLRVKSVFDASKDVISRCSIVSRQVMEEAKKGLDTKFKHLLRSPPYGALLKIQSSVCSEKKLCSMYSSMKCTTKNISKNGGAFPECFEYQILDNKLPPLIEENVKSLCTAIILALRAGWYPILIME